MTQTRGQEQGLRRVPAGTLSWLERELADWQAEGRVDAATAVGIRSRYEAGSRLPLARLLTGLGAAFVGVGLVWLVAANVDRISPLGRFGAVVLLWLAAVSGAELLHARRPVRDTWVGALRGLAAVAFGAVVFQAAQSLQVPAYDPGLVGFWAAGALLQAYATGATVPLLVGIASGTVWLLLTVVDRVPSLTAAALSLLLAGVLGTVAAVLHQGRLPRDADAVHLPRDADAVHLPRDADAVHLLRDADVGLLPHFAAPWRFAGAALALLGLFLAALPDADRDVGPGLTGALAAAAVLAALAGALRGDRVGRQEAGAAVALVAAGLLVASWTVPAPDATTDGLLSGAALARAVATIALYLLAALWIAALGVLRDQPVLTRLATGALVLFTVVQSFAVFQPILSGAALFLALGTVLGLTGYLVERGRRRLVRSVDAAPDGAGTSSTSSTSSTGTTGTTDRGPEDGS